MCEGAGAETSWVIEPVPWKLWGTSTHTSCGEDVSDTNESKRCENEYVAEFRRDTTKLASHPFSIV